MLARMKNWFLCFALIGAPLAGVLLESAPVHAAPAPRYRVGMRVKAKRNCTVQGFEVKKGVVLSVASVATDDKGRVASVDLTMSGMTIGGVPAAVVDSLFASI